MMKGRVFATLLGILFLAGLLAISGAAQEPAIVVQGEHPVPASRTTISLDDPGVVQSPSAPADVGLSTVNHVSPSQIMIGFEYDLCFNVTVDSPDDEYLDRFDVDLPDNWTIVWVSHLPENTNCGWSSTEGQEAGNVAYWQVDTVLPSGCGAWDSGTYDFCVRISVPDCSGEPWSMAWNILGDGYAGEPHEVSGTAGPLYCKPLGIYLTPDNIISSGCPGVPQDFTINLFNYTLADTTFSLSYGVSTGSATLTGPDGIYLAHGVDQDFLVTLTPWACLDRGDEVLAWALAEDGSTYDLTWLYRNIYLTSCPDSGCRYVYLPVTLRDY